MSELAQVLPDMEGTARRMVGVFSRSGRGAKGVPLMFGMTSTFSCGDIASRPHREIFLPTPGMLSQRSTVELLLPKPQVLDEELEKEREEPPSSVSTPPVETDESEDILESLGVGLGEHGRRKQVVAINPQTALASLENEGFRCQPLLLHMLCARLLVAVNELFHPLPSQRHTPSSSCCEMDGRRLCCTMNLPSIVS